MSIWPSLAARMSSKVRWQSPFLRLEIALRQQPAQPPIGRAIGRVGEDLEAVDRDEARADQKLDGLSFLPLLIGAHDAGKAVAVGDADGGKAERLGGRDHFGRMRAAAQEGEVGGDGKLGIGSWVDFGFFTYLYTHERGTPGGGSA